MLIETSILITLQELKTSEVSESKVHTLPRMFALSKNGAVRVYEISVEDMGDHAVMTTRKKVTLNGKWTEDTYEYWEGVNIGKSNETTYFEQAFAEAKSAWKRLQDAGFTEVLPDKGAKFNTDANGKIKPMLAISFNEKKIKFPCLCQPKYDGCVSRGTKILTEYGYITIGDIVSEKMKVKVFSQNSAGELELKPIIGWATNGDNKTKWFTISSLGRKIVCTDNHRIYTNRGYVRADEVTLDDMIYQARMSDYGKEILTGMLLGDSCLYYEKGSWRTFISSSNKEFAIHKAKLLGVPYGYVTEYTSGYGSKCFRVDMSALTAYIDPMKYMEYRSKKYRRRMCIPVKELLEMITDASLSVWYADDGSIMFNNGNRKTPRIILNTQRYSLRQLREFIKFFVIRYDCCPTIVKDKRLSEKGDGAGCILTFTTEDSLKILGHLKDKVLKGVEYKYYYENIEYLQPAKLVSEACPIDSIISKIRCEEKYDLEIEDNHNYFANGVLLHNCRMTISESGGKVHLLSRKGKEFDIPHIKKWANENRHLLPLDGELYNHKELTFQEIISAVKKVSAITDDIKYVVYDRPIDGVNNNDRWNKLLSDFSKVEKDAPAYISEWTLCTCMKHVWDYHKECVEKGYEGVIIRNLDGKYEFGFRSNNLIKLKTFDDSEFEIADVIEASGRDAGTGVLVLYLPGHEGEEITEDNTFKAKPQGPRKLRKEYLDNADIIIGKKATVQYQGLSDAGVPRFPSAITIRDYE